MVIDSSALVAIMMQEPPADRLAEAAKAAHACRVSAATLVEAGVVVFSRLGSSGEQELHALMRHLRIEVLPFTEDHAEFAREAFRRFGKGRHPAALNLGDCFAYALARALGEPLLFVGDDFSRTDVRVASY